MDLPPPKLFKYRSIDLGYESGTPYKWDRAILQQDNLWASSPVSFNDPFDCIPAIDLSGTPTERSAFAKRWAARHSQGKARAARRRDQASAKKALKSGFRVTEEQGVKAWTDLLPNLGVVCFAERPDDMLMWGYYSNGHRGYCLEFDTSAQPIGLAHRVVYNAERAVFRPLNADRTELMEHTLLRKADFWEHEREWRIVSRPVGNLQFPREALKAIIFGAHIPVESENAIREIVTARTLSVEMKRAKLDTRTYRLSIGPA